MYTNNLLVYVNRASKRYCIPTSSYRWTILADPTSFSAFITVPLEWPTVARHRTPPFTGSFLIIFLFRRNGHPFVPLSPISPSEKDGQYISLSNMSDTEVMGGAEEWMRLERGCQNEESVSSLLLLSHRRARGRKRRILHHDNISLEVGGVRKGAEPTQFQSMPRSPSKHDPSKHLSIDYRILPCSITVSREQRGRTLASPRIKTQRSHR